MKTGTSKISLILVAVVGLVWIVQAGTLEPPGPPAPTMKPLSEVEPRIPLSNASFSIAAPGSYYLTEDIVGLGLTINVNDVTLDLRGFSITGTGTPTPGIDIDGAVNVVIHDGTVQGFDSGVLLSNLSQATLSRLRIRGNTTAGVRIVSSDARVKGCDVFDNGTDGINMSFDEISYEFGSAEILDNSISSNGANGVLADSAFLLIKGNRVRMNLGDGIGVSMADAQILDNVVTSNNGNGITMSLASGSIIGNRSFSNGGVGINVTDSSAAQQVAQNVASNNSVADYSLDAAASAAPVSTIAGSPGAWDNIALVLPSP